MEILEVALLEFDSVVHIVQFLQSLVVGEFVPLLGRRIWIFLALWLRYFLGLGIDRYLLLDLSGRIRLPWLSIFELLDSLPLGRWLFGIPLVLGTFLWVELGAVPNGMVLVLVLLQVGDEVLVLLPEAVGQVLQDMLVHL